MWNRDNRALQSGERDRLLIAPNATLGRRFKKILFNLIVVSPEYSHSPPVDKTRAFRVWQLGFVYFPGVFGSPWPARSDSSAVATLDIIFIAGAAGVRHDFAPLRYRSMPDALEIIDKRELLVSSLVSRGLCGSAARGLGHCRAIIASLGSVKPRRVSDWSVFANFLDYFIIIFFSQWKHFRCRWSTPSSELQHCLCHCRAIIVSLDSVKPRPVSDWSVFANFFI